MQYTMVGYKLKAVLKTPVSAHDCATYKELLRYYVGDTEMDNT